MRKIRKIYNHSRQDYDKMAGIHPAGGYRDGYKLLKKINGAFRKGETFANI